MKEEIKVDIKTTPQPVESVLERPDLVIGPRTGNIGLVKGTAAVYVKIVDPGYSYVKKVGDWTPLLDAVPYTGPIDAEMMANILIYGG